MGYNLVDASIRQFVDNLERSLNVCNLDTLLRCLRSHGLSTKESFIRILRGYVNKIHLLSNSEPDAHGQRKTLKRHFLHPPRHSTACVSLPEQMKMCRNDCIDETNPPFNLVACGCRGCNSLNHRSKHRPKPIGGESESREASFLDNRGKGDNFTESVIKNLRRDVATKLRYICQSDHQEKVAKVVRRQPKELQTLFNPQKRLTGGAETGAAEADQQRVRNLLKKMAEIEEKINDFRQRALNASRLKSDVEQLQAALQTERELYRAKLNTVEAEYRKQIESAESQVQISRKERNIYQKLARKLECEVRRGEKVKEKYQRRAEELEAKFNQTGSSNEYCSEVSQKSLISINRELAQTKEALKNIERKHDELLAKLDAAIGGTN